MNLTPFRSNRGEYITNIKKKSHHYGLALSSRQVHAGLWRTKLKSGVLYNASKNILGFISSETLLLSTRNKHS